METGEGSLSTIAIFAPMSQAIETFTPSTKSWKRLHAVTEEICQKEFCAIGVGQVIYVFAYDQTSFRLDLSKPEKSWIELPKRALAGRVQVLELSGQLYIFHNESSQSELIEILSNDQLPWKQIKKPSPSRCEAITSAEGCVFMFGGYNGSYLRRSIKFNPSTNSRMQISDMPTRRCSARAVELDHKIYVFGGENDCDGHLRTMECFDIGTQTWMTIKPMHFPHHYFDACVVDGKIYAVDSVSLCDFMIEEYVPSADTWNDVIVASDMIRPLKSAFALHF